MERRIGWRQTWDRQCEYRWYADVPKGQKVVQCERPKNHKGWHCCDQSSHERIK